MQLSCINNCQIIKSNLQFDSELIQLIPLLVEEWFWLVENTHSSLEFE